MPSRDLLGGILEKIALLSSTAPRKTLFILTLITVFSGWYAWGIDIDPTILNLTPKDRPVVQEYVHSEMDFSHTEFMMAVIETPQGLPMMRYRTFIREFQKRLSEIPQIESQRLNFDQKLVKNIQAYLDDHSLMLIPPENLVELNQLLSPEQIDAKFKLPSPYRNQQWKQAFDPLDVLSFSKSLSPLTEIAMLDRSNEFFITKDPRTVFFIVGITSPWYWFETRKIVEQAAVIEQKVWNEVMPKVMTEHPQQVMLHPKITWVGKAMDVLRLTEAVGDSFKSALGWSSILTLLVFCFFFRNLRAMFWAYIPLFMGIIWSFALARLVIGQLNILSIMTGATLVGLGIDFPSYLLNQYFQSRGREGVIKDHLVMTWRKTGRFVFFGALTTIMTFSILVFSRLPAFKDIAIITSCGLMLTLLAVLIALPAIIALTERGQRPPSMWRYPIWLTKLPVKRPKLIILLSCVFYAVLIFFITRFQFASAMEEAYYMFKQPGEMVREEYDRFSNLFGSTLIPMRLIIKGEYWDEALKKNEQLYALLKKYQDRKQIAYFDSLYYLLPSYSRQEKQIPLLNKLENLDPEKFFSVYDRAAQEVLKSRKIFSRETKQAYPIYGKALKALLGGRRMILPHALKEAGLEKILNHYSAEKNGNILLSTYVYLPPGDYLSEKKALLDQLKEEKFFNEEVKYLSEESIINEIRRLVIEEITWLGGMALIMTTFLLWWSMRSLKKTLLTLIPLLLGGAAALGAYTFLAGPFSIFNLMLVPIYIGMATDDALHLSEELMEPGEGEPISRALRKWGGMIILTSVTNIIGFGSNLFTEIEVLRRIGVWIMLALVCELIGSILMLPALFKIFIQPEENTLPNQWDFGTKFASKFSGEN